MNQKQGYEIIDFDRIESVACPCGKAKRGLESVTDFPGTIHLTEISTDARSHYHKQLTETYYVLECEPGSKMELDGVAIPVRIGSCIMIRPGTRHRGLGKMRVLIVVFPKFDPNDEWFDS